MIVAASAIVRGEQKLEYGKGCFIDVGAYLNCAGGAWNDYGGRIRLGDNCEIGPYCVLHGAGGITLGNGVHLGPHVTITANQLRYEPGSAPVMEFAPVTIEDGVLVGPNASIAPGVTIGKGARIAPNSAVMADVPAGAVVAGSPARVLAGIPRERAAG
jgi:acetyltransferase-like isoleucine patch superfamily enzyme